MCGGTGLLKLGGVDVGMGKTTSSEQRPALQLCDRSGTTDGRSVPWLQRSRVAVVAARLVNPSGPRCRSVARILPSLSLSLLPTSMRAVQSAVRFFASGSRALLALPAARRAASAGAMAACGLAAAGAAGLVAAEWSRNELQVLHADANAEPAKEEAVARDAEGTASEVVLEPEYKYILIGSGTASYSAAKAILEREPGARILIIGEEKHLPYMRPPLSKELWNEKADPNSLHFMDWQGKSSSVFYPELDRTNVTFLMGHRVTQMDLADHLVVVDDGRKVRYQKCLVATGGTPRGLPLVPDAVKHKVATFRTVDDFMALQALAKSGGKAVIVGGSFLGTELAYALASGGKQHGASVVSVFPEPSILARVLPRYVSEHTSRLLMGAGVQLRPNRIVTNVREGSNGKVFVVLDNNENIEADLVVVAVGIQPNTAVFQEAGLEIDPRTGGIVVNSELEARADVFVAGDVASYYDAVLGRRRVEHYDHAAASGRQAGLNMAGARRPYTYTPMFWSDIGSTGYEALGDLDSNLDTVAFWKDVSIQQQGAPWYFASSSPTNNLDGARGAVFYLKNKRIVGALLWNMPGKIDIARKIIAVKAKVNTEELKKEFGL